MNSEFYEHRPIATFLLLWSSSIRSNGMWDTVIGDKAFCKSISSSFGSSFLPHIVFREEKSVFRVSTEVATKYCHFHGGRGPM